MSLNHWVKAKSDPNSPSKHLIDKTSHILNISKKDTLLWIDCKKTLEQILNLKPSEDAVITHLLVPFIQRALGYSVSEIDVKPKLTVNYGSKVVKIGGESDIVLRKLKRPAVVIEVKAYGKPLKSKTENAEGQAFDYTRANELKPRPPYYITTNVVETHIYETATRKEKILPPIKEKELITRLNELVKVIGRANIRFIKRAVQAVIRKPVENQKEFERVLFKCQDEMREAKEARTGKSAFDEMNKLLFIKLFEDRRERRGEENRFTLKKVIEEGENYIKGTLFEDIKDYFRKRGIRVFRDQDKIELDENTVNRIVGRLENLLLVDEDGKVYPPIGHVYESFVSTIFRGENGQYFTPRPIVNFMVGLTQIGWGESGMKILDPCVGSAGFLLSAMAMMDQDLKNAFMTSDEAGKLVFKSEQAKEEYQKCKKNSVHNCSSDLIMKTALQRPL